MQTQLITMDGEEPVVISVIKQEKINQNSGHMEIKIVRNRILILLHHSINHNVVMEEVVEDLLLEVQDQVQDMAATAVQAS